MNEKMNFVEVPFFLWLLRLTSKNCGTPKASTNIKGVVTWLGDEINKQRL